MPVSRSPGKLRRLNAAHEHGIIHRDLKPSNIMFGTNGRVVITDFGLARLKPEPDDITATASTPAGTLPYMAPELFREDAPRRRVISDSLGVVMHEIITGRLPVPAAANGSLLLPASRVRPAVPLFWDQVIGTCLEADPAQRCQSADAALALL